ncbi:MAG: replicative DNA helicase [Clostridia bacterium]|nr:replicative DNA helicase [Clostridia bacterium]
MRDSIGEAVKRMPFSIQAEQSLLGSLLINPSALTDIVDKVRDTDFYLKDHAGIYAAILEISRRNGDVDVVTLLDVIDREGLFDSREAAENYLRRLTEVVPSALNIGDYAGIVLEKSLLRRLIEYGDDLSRKAYSETESSDSLLAYAEGELSKLAQGRDTRRFQELSKLISSLYDRLAALAQNPEAFEGLNTGYSELDRILGGNNPTDLVLIGARPGMGKTSFALNVAVNVAVSTKKKIAIFSLEMSAEQLASRIMASTALVDSAAMRSGKLTDSDWLRLSSAVETLSGTTILIDDTANLTVTDMKAKLRREKDVGLVIVDYLGLMQGERYADNRVLEIGDITRGLKLMAKDLECPVICVSQLSRGVESRNSKNKRPMLSDLRDSGSIEQDADSVLFIYRPDYYGDSDGKNDDGEEEGGSASREAPVAEIIVAKNRHGSVGTAKLNWLKQFTAFRSIERRFSDRDVPPDRGRRPT